MKRHLRFENVRASELLLALAVFLLAARLVGQVFFSDSPFGGTEGLLSCYGETIAIGLGLAAIRVRHLSPRSDISSVAEERAELARPRPRPLRTVLDGP
jgi:hypothetical protein